MVLPVASVMTILVLSFTNNSNAAGMPTCVGAEAVLLAASVLTATPVMADPVAGKPLAVTVLVAIAEPALVNEAPLAWSWGGNSSNTTSAFGGGCIVMGFFNGI